jgi:hypothetical protein
MSEYYLADFLKILKGINEEVTQKEAGFLVEIQTLNFQNTKQ